MASMGERRFLLKGDSQLHTHLAPSDPVSEHGWHCDIPGATDTHYPRIKGILYLTDTTREQGAIRFVAGSHHEAFHRELRGLQGSGQDFPGDDGFWKQANFYGVRGRDVPGVAVECKPGDFVLFHQSLFHYVFNHADGRRGIQISWAGFPDTPARLASNWRNAQWPFSARQGNRLGAHPNPAVRAMCLAPEEIAPMRAAAEQANVTCVFPDVDINQYAWAVEHRKRTGIPSWTDAYRAHVATQSRL
jgi:hypothetical protein